MRFNTRCVGCKKPYRNYESLVNHGNRCIKKMKWLHKQGYLNDKMLKVNISHIKKMGFKQT